MKCLQLSSLLIFLVTTSSWADAQQVPTVSFTLDNFVALESEGIVEVCIMLNAPLAIVLDVSVTVTSGNATEGIDFTVLNSPIQLTLRPGTTEACTDDIQIIDDEIYEGKEIITLELMPIFPIPVGISSAVVTINDDDILCEDGAVRLVNGTVPDSGRVEICFNNEWGTVCDDIWDDNDATVVCRQLGLPSTASRPWEEFVGEAEGSIWLDDVMCSGAENFLQMCPHGGLGNHDCTHREDAGVICPHVCEGNSIRLVGGNDTAGRVEVCYNNVWGSVCDDVWDDSNARVVCRQLGIPSQFPSALRNAAYGEGDGPIWLDNLRCNGNESSLQLCPHMGVGESNCDHDEDAGVVCIRDSVVVLRFDREVYTVSEGDRLELVVERVGSLDSEIFFAVSGDGIIEVGMFEAGASAANSISVFINISDDRIAPEPNEMFEVTLSLTQPNPLVSIPDPLATVVVIDNDPVVEFSPTAYTVREGDDRIVRATIELTPPTPEDIAVAIRLISDTAVVGEDIVNLDDPIFTLSAEAFAATLLLSNLIDDGIFEPNETFFVEIFNVSIGAVGAQSRATVVIIDNDPVVQFSLTAYTVREGDFPFSVNIDLLPAPSEDITLTICFISDTAVVGEDVEALVNPFVTISAGTFASTLLGTDLIDDSIVEETEMFFVEIVNVSIGAVGPQSRATIIIFDNDGEVCKSESDAVWEILWPNTLVGEIARVPCGVDYIGNATRMCGAGGVWADPDVIGCSSRVFFKVQVEIAALLGEEEVNVEETLKAFEGLVKVTENQLFPADINTTIEDVDRVLSLLEDDAMDLEVENATVIFEVLDNLLVEGNLESFNVLEDVGGSQRVLNNVERYGLYVSQALQNEGGDIVRNQAGENIVLRAGSVRVEEDETFPNHAEVSGLNVSSDTSASIILPSQLLASRSQGGRVGVASVLFRNLQAFLPDDSDTPTLRSLVISGQVANEGENGVIDPVLEDNPVIITFSFEAGEYEDIGEDDVDCVFWDFGGNAATSSDTVRWSTDGLRTESVTRDGNTVTVTCASFHLTSFAVLVDVGGAQLEDEALQIVSYIGLAISLACLLLTIIFFLSLGKKLFSAVHNFVHLNLAISLFIGYLVFAVGIELAGHDRVACNVVTALIQYFLLAAFCWMMCEGIMLYLMLVMVFSKLKKKWWFFALLGWGIPVIFVVIGLASVHDEYGVKADDESHDYYKYCWLSSGNGTNAIWTFVAPVLAIIIINTVFLVLVLYSIFNNRAGRQQKVDQGFRVDAVQYLVKASVILLPLLGLTWVFGLFAVNENTAVFAWLFTILNSLQGLFIFTFHVLRNDRIWGRIKKTYKSYSTSRASKSTDSTGVKSGKYRSVSSTTSGIEMKEKQSLADPEDSEFEAVDDKKPTKELA